MKKITVTIEATLPERFNEHEDWEIENEIEWHINKKGWHFNLSLFDVEEVE